MGHVLGADDSYAWAMAIAEEVLRADEASMVIQTLIFSKEKFTEAEARKWVAAHGFKIHKPPDITAKSIRIRQRDPGDFKAGSFRTWSITSGVQAIGGELK